MSYIRKWNKSLIYCQCGKRKEKELTYELFKKNVLEGNYEDSFRFKDFTFDIAFHFNGKMKIYELNINGYDEDATHYFYNSAEELLENGRIDGKTIKEIWNDLEN